MKDEIITQVLQIAKKYHPEKRFLLAILQDIQRKYNYLPEEAMETIADYLGISAVKVFAVATFYRAFSLQPKGEYIIKVCDGTACHIKGSLNLLEELKSILGIEPGETTADGKFSLETVNCIGSCALAPVIMINDEYYGKLTPAKLREVMQFYRKGGQSNVK